MHLHGLIEEKAYGLIFIYLLAQDQELEDLGPAPAYYLLNLLTY